MTSISGLMRNAGVYSASNIINALIPFLLLPILTRVLAPAEYGVLAMFGALLGVLSAFTGLSVQGAINVRFVDRDKIDFPRYVGSCFFVLMASTLVTLIGVVFLARHLERLTSLPPFWLYLAVFVSGANFLILMRLSLWMMAKKPYAYALFQLLLSGLNVGFSLILVLLLKQGYEGRLWGQSVTIGAFALIGLFSMRRGGWIAFHPRMDYVREALAFGVPLVPHVLGAFLASMADRFVINQQLGLTAAGFYMVAVQLSMAIGLVADAFNKAFIPWLFEKLAHGGAEDKHRIVRLSWSYFGIALCLSGLVMIVAEGLVFLVAGEQYREAVGALRWLALGQAFNGMYFMVTNYIFFKRKTAYLAWLTLLTGLIGVVLAWILAPLIGISGVGLAFALSMVSRFLLTWGLAARVCPMPWFSSFKAYVV